MFTTVKDPEVKLVEMTAGLREEAGHWQALEFRFSQLLEHYRSDYQLKIAVNLIHDLVKSLEGGIFIFGDGNIIVVCRDVSPVLVEKVIFQLRYLFMDDPLAYHRDGQENEKFCRHFDLGYQYKEFSEVTKRKVAMLSKVVSRQPSSEEKTSTFNAASLAELEKDLAAIDIANLIRRQPVCGLTADQKTPRRVFDEIYINIQQLRSVLKVDTDLFSNRWLFRYLTQLLDERIIQMLRQNVMRYLDSPVSLNLNVQTLLSNTFSELDVMLKPSAKVSIVIELQAADVFADMTAFTLARDSVQKLGYRICLDGLTHLSFTQLSREGLGFDLAKLQWNAGYESDIRSRDNQKLLEAIKECGPNRVILCRCDNRKAIDYGQALGISLFQGRHIDATLNPSSKIQN